MAASQPDDTSPQGAQRDAVPDARASVVANVTDYFTPRSEAQERIPRLKRERLTYRERLRHRQGGPAWPR